MSLAYANQKRLDAEAKRLQSNALALVKQTNQWLLLSENFNQALKVDYLNEILRGDYSSNAQEIGDVGNWAQTIEDDIQVISEALEAAYKGGVQL